MTLEELKIRQLTNQYLTVRADKLTVVRDLCGVQAQFMANAIHSLRIRCTDFSEQTVSDGLVKNWTLRGTVHVFAKSDLPLFIRCNNGKDYRKNEWTGYTFWNQRDKWALTPDRQKYFSDIILKAVQGAPQTRDELKDICRRNGMTKPEEDSMFDGWGGGIRELCERGFMNYTVQEKKTYTVSDEFTPMSDEDAELEIARRYFTNLSPATIHDAMYFLGAKQSDVKRWLARLPYKTAEYGGKIYYYIENGKSYDKELPPCIFLAGFDGLMLGYQKKESLYLPPEHLRCIFNLAGIVMPSILLNGKVVGKWQKKNKKLTLTPFTMLTPKDKATITEAAMSLWSEISIAFE